MSSCACLQVARLAEEEAEQAAAIAAVAAASPPKQVCFDAATPDFKYSFIDLPAS